MRKDESDKALPDFDRAVAIDRDSVDALRYRGVCWCNADQYDSAIADYTKAIRLAPKDAELYFNRGLMWERKLEHNQAVLDYITLFFARPALIEVWHNGYRSGITSAERPEWNLVVRLLMSGVEVNPPADLARTEFNLYLRFITSPLVFLITLFATAMAAEGIVIERTGETWDSLIATPLSARDILRANMLAALWRMRMILATLLVLWTIGLVAGSVHPAGYLVSLLVVAAWTWLLLVYGMSISIAAKDEAPANNRFMGLLFLGTGTLALPFLVPSMFNSVLLGTVSPPFLAWMSFVSYRDVRNACAYSVYPALQWMNIDTGEGPLSVAAACLIGIIIPTVWGLYLWRDALANFDRLIGRPCKTTEVATG